jgi:hypothetical protein
VAIQAPQEFTEEIKEIEPQDNLRNYVANLDKKIISLQAFNQRYDKTLKEIQT